MGNSASHRDPGELHSETLLAQSKFDVDEIFILRKIWQDLADRTNGRGIDKETFLQYFPVTGLLGERLFAQFDVKKTGYVDLDDFITGLAHVCRGTADEKIHFIFNMYDTSHDNTVSKQELTTLLNQVPKHVLIHGSMPRGDPYDNHDVGLDISAGRSTPSTVKDGKDEKEYDFEELEHVDEYTNHDFVERAFIECDLNHEGRLSYEQFKMWVQKTPGVLEYIESIMPWAGKRETDASPSAKHHLQECALPTYTAMKRASSRGVMSPPNISVSLANAGGPSLATPTSRHSTGFNHFAVNEHLEIEEPVRALLTQAMESTHCEGLHKILSEILDSHNKPRHFTEEEVISRIISKSGFLWKKGTKLQLWNKRWCLLSGNCIYYYNQKSDVRPKGVIFLAGTIIEKIQDEASEIKGYFGFEILHQELTHNSEHHKHEQRILFAPSEEEREAWITLMQRAAHVVPIEEDYVIGKELGRGRFSTVHECVRKANGDIFAVKIIEKATLEADEKELLRTEIAALKLVHHPNIVNLEGLYETRTHMYIVMEKLNGGELFERIVGHPRFTESESAHLVRPLLESVAYLHDLGIVHRDLKPENILCGENLEDIKLADFGLSKMLLPKEKMDTACGTLSYVAPEVLTMQGYGKEADLWSIGVIMFLLLCGKLPFDGADNDEIIRSTIHADLKAPPHVWSKMHEDTRSIILALLNKSPRARISARDALKHPFFDRFFPYEKSRKKGIVAAGAQVLQDGAATPVASTPIASTPLATGEK